MSANCASESSITTTCPMAAPVAPPPTDFSVYDRNAQAPASQFVRAGRTNNPGPYDNCVTGYLAHERIPMQSGSRGSSTSSASEFTNADPLMLG